MQNQTVKFKRLAKKGMHISVPIADPQAWENIIKADWTIPRSFTQVHRLAQTIFSKPQRPSRSLRFEQPVKGIKMHRFEECGEDLYAKFFIALRNPLLTTKHLAILEAIMDADTPTFENSTETDHFILKWTNSSAHAADNIADSSIIDDTGDYLETAWERYNTVFGKAPYVPAGGTKIEVLFQDIDGYGLASPPDGPIQLDAENLVLQPGIRQPSSAHELFHKLQYSFGFRTKWNPMPPYKWFSEGSCAWAEVFVWQRVSGDYKVKDLFANPDLNLWDASYSALPF